MRVETHGLDLLAADFERAGKDITDEVAKTTGKACRNMQLHARRLVRGLAHLPHLPRSYTYDVTTRGSTVTGEVGAEHERLQGKLDWIPQYGSPTSSPIGQWSIAADPEIPVWVGYLEAIAADVIEKRPGDR